CRGRQLSTHAGADAVAADQDVGVLTTPAGEMHEDTGAVLLHALEIVTEVIVPFVDSFAQQPLQPIPGGEDLGQVLFRDHPSGAVERDSLLDRDSEVAGAGAALLQSFEQFRMGGYTGAPADEFDCRAFIDLRVPPDLPQKCRSKQPGHRPSNDDGTPSAP